MAKKKKSYRRSRSGMPKELKNIVAGMAVSISEPLVDKVASSFGLNLSDEIVKIGGGFAIKKLARGSGIMNSVGDAFMIIGANKLAAGGFGAIGNLFGNDNNNNGASTDTSGATF